MCRNGKTAGKHFGFRECYPAFHNVETETYDTICEMSNEAGRRMLNIKEKVQSEEGGINMLNAVNQMLEVRLNEGIEIGKKTAQVQGIQFLIETCQEMNASYDNTKFYVEMKYGLSSEEAQKYMKMFWKKRT